MAVQNPHDKFFRLTFGEPEMAAEFLKSYLPSSIVEKLQFDTLRSIDGSFIDDALQHSQSDLLFEVQTREKRQISVYFLF